MTVPNSTNPVNEQNATLQNNAQLSSKAWGNFNYKDYYRWMSATCKSLD